MNRSTQAFCQGDLRCGQDFAGTEPARRFRELLAVDSIPVSQKISRGAVSGERFEQLTSDPFGAGMLGNRNADGSTPILRKDHEDKQHPEENGRSARWSSMADHILGGRRFG